MTKMENLRPTLPDDMDADFRELISDCWHAEPSLRPSFSVILISLQNIRAVNRASLRRLSAHEMEEVAGLAAKELSREVNT